MLYFYMFQSSLVILCNIFLNLIIVEPALVPENQEFCHILLLVCKGINLAGMYAMFIVIIFILFYFFVDFFSEKSMVFYPYNVKCLIYLNIFQSGRNHLF
jgi:hypothetical protein